MLLFVSFPVFAQQSQVVCADNYYFETALTELNATLEKIHDYSVSAPSHVQGINGHHTICVTVTKQN